MWDLAKIQEIIRDVFDVVQIVSFVMTIFLARSSYEWIKLNRARWGYEVPVLVLTVTTFAFYLFILLVRFQLIQHPPAPFLFSNWSTILRLQELVTWYFYVRMRISISRDRENYEKTNGET